MVNLQDRVHARCVKLREHGEARCDAPRVLPRPCPPASLSGRRSQSQVQLMRAAGCCRRASRHRRARLGCWLPGRGAASRPIATWLRSPGDRRCHDAKHRSQEIGSQRAIHAGTSQPRLRGALGGASNLLLLYVQSTDRQQTFSGAQTRTCIVIRSLLNAWRGGLQCWCLEMSR